VLQIVLVAAEVGGGHLVSAAVATAPARPTTSALYARTAPVIDGRDDDPIWSLASLIEDFREVERGSPLIILGADGVLYVPMSTAIPDSSQRSRLLPFPGKFVRVNGTVFEQSGLHAITIASIEEVPGIHLITDAQ